MNAFPLVARLLELLGVERSDVFGRDGERLFSRWFLLGGKTANRPRLLLHLFHRTGYDRELHDHPWPYTSLILWPGYFEHTDCAMHANGILMAYTSGARARYWRRPLSILRRPAAWRHAVELDRDRPCWTLFWSGRAEREWGYWCPTGWVHWRKHDVRRMAGLDGCGE